jgi:hypothetical protein
MDTANYDAYLRTFTLPLDCTLDELDGRYYEMIDYWKREERDGDTSAKHEIESIDVAYGVLLRRFLREQTDEGEVAHLLDRRFSMQAVLNGQDQIVKASTKKSDEWTAPPRREAQLSPAIRDLDSIIDHNFEKMDLDDPSRAPGFSVREIYGDIKDAPDRAVIVRELEKSCSIGDQD